MNNLEKEFLKAYDKLSDAIFRHCYFRVFDKEKAKDLTQDAFTKTWEYIAAGAAVDNLKAFIYRVATNLIIDHHRKHKDISLEGLREDGFEPMSQDHRDIVVSAELRKVIEGINKLDDEYRDAVMMRHVEDMSVKDIAKAAGVSENVVSVRIHRGLAKLKELLK